MIIAEPLSHSDVTAIARVREGWLTALNADDVDGVIAPLADDCIAFPPNEAPSIGKDGSRAWHETRIAQFNTTLTMSSRELVGGGVWAFDCLTYAIRLAPKAGGPAMQTSGTCVWIWQRQADGRWLIARAIWNSDIPLPSGSSDADVRAIHEVAADYAASCNAGNLAGFMSACSADIVFLPPDDLPASGTEAVQRYLKDSFFDPFDVHLSFTFDDLEVTGDSASAHGPYELRLTPKSGGETIVDRGKFLDVFRRQSDASWKFARVMFNRNAPAASI